MVRGNFHGAPSEHAAPGPFEVLSSSEEDNVPIASLRHGAHAAAFDSSPCRRVRGGSRRDEDGNDERDGVTLDESYLEELEEIQHLSPLNISPLQTVLPERGLFSGWPSSPLGASGSEVGVSVD